MNKQNKTCCFTGHRRTSLLEKPIIKHRLIKTIEMLINEGVQFFGTGGALGFDTLASLSVLEMKK